MISKASTHWSIFEKARIVLKEFDSYAEGTLIDIGSGTKPFQEVFSKKTLCYYGLDILSTVDRTNDIERLKAIDVYGDALHLPFKTSSVNTVFSSFVIEHIFEYDRFFEEAHRILKIDSYFILISPLIVEVHEEPYDFFRFTRFSLEKIAQRHQFEVVHIIPVGGEFLFWGNRLAALFNKMKALTVSSVIFEKLSYFIQKVSLFADGKCSNPPFVCNYLSVFKKK